LRRDQKRVPALSRQHPARRGEQHAITSTQRWPGPLSFVYPQLVAQDQELDIPGEVIITARRQCPKQATQSKVDE
jgi:hypothetical protein